MCNCLPVLIYIIIIVLQGATVALSSTQLSISEGSLGSLSESSVCVHLTNVQDGLKRDVVVLLDTIADTAGI